MTFTHPLKPQCFLAWSLESCHMYVAIIHKHLQNSIIVAHEVCAGVEAAGVYAVHK